MKEWSKEVFAKNLRYYMELNGKTQKELADIIGVSAPTMNDWLKAKKYPRIDKIERLAITFGILKSDLIEEKKKPAENDGLSKKKIELMRFAESVPEDKAAWILSLMKSILEGEK